MRRELSWLIFPLLILLLAPSLEANGLSLRDLDPPKNFLAGSSQSTIHSIEPSRQTPGFLKFRVISPHATYDVEGVLPLRKLLQEIEVIGQVKRGEAGTGFGDGLGDSVVATGEGAVNLVVHPIQSAKKIGRAVGKLGRSVGGIFREGEEGEKTTFGEKMLGGSEREVAKKLGVDVYTPNLYLKEMITRMAKARLGGKGTTAAVKFLIPVIGVPAIAVTAVGINTAADQAVNDTSKPDLFRANQEALLDLGLEELEVLQLLNSPHYTPREVTYIRFYLERLKDVPGHRDLLKTAANAKSVGEARKILYESQMAAGGMTEKIKFQRIYCFEEGMGVVESSRIIFITPYDYLDRSPLGNRAVERALDLKKQWRKNSVEFWNGGKATSSFSSSVFSKGIKVRSWVLFTGSEEARE